jgi:pimeloyl-ACP methyl ester carboxylesterase
VLVGIGAGVTVFAPGARLEPKAGAAYWDLPTGSRLAYSVIRGTGTVRATPVIRLHGGPGTPGEGKDDLDAALSRDGFDVYEYDQVGSGDSPRPKGLSGYTVERQVADLEAVRAKIGADRVVLAGASWGATLAAEYLVAHPERVAKVVFTSPGALWTPEWTDEEAGQLWDRLTPDQQAKIDKLGAGLRFPAWSVLMGVNPKAAHALVPDAEVDALFQQLLTIAGSAATCHPGGPIELPTKTPGFYANQLIAEDEKSRPDPRPALKAIHVPALVLRGECDYKAWPITREYRDTLPGAKLLYFPGAGHVIGADRPAEFVAAVTAFLADRPLPGPVYTGKDNPAGK